MTIFQPGFRGAPRVRVYPDIVLAIVKIAVDRISHHNCVIFLVAVTIVAAFGGIRGIISVGGRRRSHGCKKMRIVVNNQRIIAIID